MLQHIFVDMVSNERKLNLAAELGKREPFRSLRQETYINLLRTHEHLTTAFAALFKQYGLSDSQYNVLRILRGVGEPMQIYQIAERLIFSQADISRLINRLEANELVARRRCEDDGRVVWITLTDKAQKLLKKIDRPLEKLHDSQFGDLTDRELTTLNHLLFKARQSEKRLRATS
jgi:MarR family transcriptional regulator, 2-MHQ and catechol-resistance regulon repressor